MSDPRLRTLRDELAPHPARVDALVRDLDRRRLERPPARGWVVPTALALAATALIIGLLPQEDAGIGFRGVDPVPVEATAADVQLRLAVERGDEVVSLERGDEVVVGDRIFFRLSVDGPSTVTVWVEGPDVQEGLGSQDFAGAASDDLRTASGLQAWRFDTPGRYAFRASSTGDDSCSPPSCSEQIVEVR